MAEPQTDEPELVPFTPPAVGRTVVGSPTGIVSDLADIDTLNATTSPQQQSGTWAPFSVPRHRRLQTAAVITWSMAPLITTALFFFCLSVLVLALATYWGDDLRFMDSSFPPLWPILIIYLIWAWGFDRAPENGGRPSVWYRQGYLWTYFAGYFPISLVKTEDLPPDRNYIFGYHPHGIIGMGAIANFGSDATRFSTLFPGLQMHLLTLATNFYVPFFRDLLLAMGMGSVSARSCSNILRKGQGSSLTIVVGGATESLSARPGTADLTLRRRLGFIKLAVREGADLVPVFSFGENDLFEQLSNRKGTKLYTLQKQFQAVFGFTLPIFHGRGIFNYSFGLMPYRHPIVSVVGRPVRVKRNANPSTEELQEIQEKYITELVRIWDTYKDVHAQGRKRELSIVE